MVNDWIKKEVEDLYGVSPSDVKEIPRGSAEIYLLSQNEHKYIFKVFQQKMTEERVLKELGITEHLRNKGFLVPEYIPLKDNSGYYGFTSNKRIAVLQKYISGDVLDDNKATFSQMISMAELYATLLVALRDYKAELPCFSLDIFSKQSISSAIEEAQKFQLTLLDPDICQKINDKIEWMYELLEMKVDFIEDLSFEKSHGDYNPFQLIFNVEGSGTDIAVLDFASAKVMPIVFELVRCFLFASPGAIDGSVNMDEFVPFVIAFDNLFALNEYDLKYMFYPYYIRSVTNLFGYREYSLTGDETFKFLGDQIYNQCNSLHHNIKEYSTQLIMRMRGDV